MSTTTPHSLYLTLRIYYPVCELRYGFLKEAPSRGAINGDDNIGAKPSKCSWCNRMATAHLKANITDLNKADSVISSHAKGRSNVTCYCQLTGLYAVCQVLTDTMAFCWHVSKTDYEIFLQYFFGLSMQLDLHV